MSPNPTSPPPTLATTPEPFIPTALIGCRPGVTYRDRMYTAHVDKLPPWLRGECAPPLATTNEDDDPPDTRRCPPSPASTERPIVVTEATPRRLRRKPGRPPTLRELSCPVCRERFRQKTAAQRVCSRACAGRFRTMPKVQSGGLGACGHCGDVVMLDSWGLMRPHLRPRDGLRCDGSMNRPQG